MFTTEGKNVKCWKCQLYITVVWYWTVWFWFWCGSTALQDPLFGVKEQKCVLLVSSAKSKQSRVKITAFRSKSHDRILGWHQISRKQHNVMPSSLTIPCKQEIRQWDSWILLCCFQNSFLVFGSQISTALPPFLSGICALCYQWKFFLLTQQWLKRIIKND